MRASARWMVIPLLGLLAGCSLFDGKEEKKLEGERIPILSASRDIKPSQSLTGTPVSLPAPLDPASWPQEGGEAAPWTGHLAGGGFDHMTQAGAGEGNGWESGFIPGPVVSPDVVFVMDAQGYVSAHRRDDITRIQWTAKPPEEESEHRSGGGLAYDSGRIFAVMPGGMVYALDASDGKMLWKRRINAPLHAAPRVAGNSVLVLSADSRLFALSVRHGLIQWQHQGIREQAGLLARVMPSVARGAVVVPYPSGEIYTLTLEGGEPVWSDSVLLPQRTKALGVFSGVSANPVIAGGAVYNVSYNGLLAANDMRTGLRIWERPLSTVSAPWVAGDFLFVLTSDHRLLAIFRSDGRIRWIASLPDANDDDAPKAYQGPYLTGGKLAVFTSDGDALMFSPEDGKALGSHEIASGSISAPAFSGETMYFVDRHATLYAVW